MTDPLLERLSIGAFVLDSEGRIVGVNEAFRRLFALEAESPGQPVGLEDLFLDEQDRRGLQALLERDGVARRFDARCRRNGTGFWARWSVAPSTRTAGRFEGLVEDVHALKSDEQLLVESRESALSASRRKSEFLASMSHEIRTPMNGVIGMTELLLGTALDEEQREFAETIRSSGRALLTLLNDVLDLSKIEAGRLELEETQFAIRSLVEDVRRSLSALATTKGLGLRTEVASGTPDDLVGDPTRLRQVLVNLIGNAIKFTANGTVTVRVVGVPGEGALTRLRISVEDTGIGMDAEQQQRIFSPFAQGERSTSRRFGGTGLGLAISARIVEQMGGRITVESRVGQGSNFWFDVSLRVGSLRGEGPGQVTTALVGIPVLVVGPDAATNQATCAMLEPWNMRCAPVTDPGEAVRAVRRAEAHGEPFRVALVDIEIEGTDGFAVAEALRAAGDHDATAIVLVTAAGVRGDAERCRDMGIAGYVTRPFDPALLHEILRFVLARDAGSSLVTRHEVRDHSTALRILLAEDDAVNRRVAAKLIERAGHHVTAVEDGVGAVQRVEAERFDVVLMDVQMPRLDGFEATARIREREQLTGERVPILALTAHAVAGFREQCLARGMDGYLSKPIQPERLFALLTEISEPDSRR